MDIVLPGKPTPDTQEKFAAPSAAYEKHKKLKTIWLVSTAATAATGTALILKSNSLYNDYKIATTDAKDIREQYEKLDKISPVAFGAALFSGVMTGIQAKKQKDAKARLGFRMHPAQDGALVLSLIHI